MAALADGLGLDDTDRERLLAAARTGRSPGYHPFGVRSFPRGTDDFVGRDGELLRLTELAGSPGDLTGEDDATARQPVVVAVSALRARARPAPPGARLAGSPTASRTGSSWWTCAARTTPRPPRPN